MNKENNIHGLFNNERALADIYLKERREKAKTKKYSLVLSILFFLLAVLITSYGDTISGVYPSL